MALKFLRTLPIQSFLSFVIFFGLFFSKTGQKVLRTELLILGVSIYLLFILYQYFKVRRFEFHLDYLFCIFLTLLVFLRWAEYDPLQVFPQKLSLKIVCAFWLVALTSLRVRLADSEFLRIGILISVIPCFALSFYHPYPFLILGLGLFFLTRKDDLEELFQSWTTSFLFITSFILMVTEWDSDFALKRASTILLAVLFFHNIRALDESQKKKWFHYYTFLYFFFVLMLIILFSKNPNFQIFKMHEALFRIPINIIGSNSLLIFIIGFVYFISKPNKLERLYLLFLMVCGLTLILITGSRASMVSVVLAFCLIVIFLIQNKHKFKIFGFSFFVLLLLVYLFSKIGKSFSNLDSTLVRLNIWKLHTIATFQNAPVFGFGLFPEESLLFTGLESLPKETFETIQFYLDHFNSHPLAHNLYFQIFSSFGLIGASIFLILFIFLLYQMFLSWKRLQLTGKAFMVLLLVWFLHELLDFNSLELSNAILLAGLLSYLPKTESALIKRISLGSRERILTTTKYLLVSLFFLLLVRWTVVEETSFMYKTKIIESNFHHFELKDSNNHLNIPTPSNLKYQFFGDKYYFQELALSEGTDKEGEILTSCFNFKRHSAFCFYRLIHYQKRKGLLNDWEPLYLYFLQEADPFRIYRKAFDDTTRN
ncbi:MAG: O-antigen ligase family protein [Leptospira sp.]|nr:O-antigen ligase family protein [Leptospira sp.]